MCKKSKVCFSWTTGNPRSEYDSMREAEKGAEWTTKKLKKPFKPYACDDCGKWHIAPVKTSRQYCPICKGSSDGRYKRLYATREEAEKTAKCIYQKEGKYLRAYECEHYHGWHLTKNDASPIHVVSRTYGRGTSGQLEESVSVRVITPNYLR